MAPNLLVASQTLFQPRKWFRASKNEKPKRKTERWEDPIPGLYEYIPRRGWFLVEKDKENTADATEKGGPVLTIENTTPKETIKMDPPVAVRYSKVLKRHLLGPDYQNRKKDGEIENSQGKKSLVTFFRLDDGASWVNFLDEHGEFIPGPYRLWFFDQSTNRFRHMLRRDDPEYQRSQANSRVQSRQNSIDHDAFARRRSQESRSTEYRGGPNSNRDGMSVPSTGANTRPNSNAPSQANSRRGSFSRGPLSPRIPLDEAGVALRMIQKERAAKQAADLAQNNMAEKLEPTAPTTEAIVEKQKSVAPIMTTMGSVPVIPAAGHENSFAGQTASVGA